ncbi:hypothetical protein [Bacillus aquiflavi]|nr:hypothetical protein [Bacillus aquiflavi]
MPNVNKKEKTLMQKLSLGFTIFCVVFLVLRFSGALDSIIEYFKS